MESSNIFGDCCQLGLHCGCIGKKLSTIKFDINHKGHTVGNIKKMTSTLGEFFTKADSFQIIFPTSATPEDKILLILAGLMIDYQNF